jgi:RNA polymerase sigma factor (sigma-70 family)
MQRRPRRKIEEVAVALVARHGAKVLATARRYAATPQDAEDAYQRGLEILLRKAPNTNEDDLLPWLKTVVMHEAFALHRQRQRYSPLTDDGRLGERPTSATITHDQAERHERLRQGAEALAGLKPQQIRALQLRALGYSYREICQLTNWTHTKVNRCLTEGRRALARRLATIESGSECAKLKPFLVVLADGDSSAADFAVLRRHLSSCLECRARLRSLRAAPPARGHDRPPRSN